jgi:hypothetical protein
MPEDRLDHCTAVLESGDIFVAGGYSKSCFIYDIEQGAWKICRNLMTRRRSASCGGIKRRDGKEEIVVAGGYD